MAESETEIGVGTALDLLSGGMGGSFPSITGGHAGPSSAGANSGSNSVTLNSSFSVAGAGSTQTTSTNAGSTSTDLNTYLILGAIAILWIATKKK